MALSLDAFLPNIGVTDTKKKIQLGQDIVDHLKFAGSTVECEEIGVFIDGVISWLNNSNFKIILNGLEIIQLLVRKMKEDFKPYLSSALPPTIDRLGDSKDIVRDQALVLIIDWMENVTSPQNIFEKLMSAFNHKNWKVREEAMVCLQKSLAKFGSQSLSLSKIVPLLVKLLGDPQAMVRDTAVTTLVDVYRHVGERVRSDLSKKYSIPANKLSMLFAKFDEIKISGGLLPTASMTTSMYKDDEPDSISRSASLGKSASKRASSAPPVKRSVFSAPKPPPSATALSRKGSIRSSSRTSSAAAGAIDEETFIKAFEDVPKVQIFSSRELEVELNKIKDYLINVNNDWEKRTESLKKVRSILLAGAADYDELFPILRSLEQPFQLSVRDLRSQVVREACITIAYLSQQLGLKVDHFCEALLPGLINLIPNCAKVMSSSGTVAVRFIIRYTHSNRIIPIITNNTSAKSKEIRKAVCELLDQLLHTWPTHPLERHIAILQEAIKRGISDADPEARAFARKAFWGFADHFKDQADSLLSSLEMSKQKMLHGELSMSNSSSSNSLNTIGRLGSTRSRASSHGSTENLMRGSSARSSLRSSIPSPKSDRGYTGSPFRSNSAIDMNALRRAKAARYSSSLASAARLPRGSGASLPRPRKSENLMVSSVTSISSPDRVNRSRPRAVSQSQPSSRSGSPSRHNFGFGQSRGDVAGSRTPSHSRRKSGIPKSTSNSREASPTRGMYSSYGGHERRLSGGTARRPSFSERSRDRTTPTRTTPVLAEKILLQSQEAEVAMADALRVPYNSQKSYDRSFNDHSDESETSSMCSERSFGGSYRNSSDDVQEILRNCSSTHWSDRKEGLIGLENLFHSRRTLNPHELRRVTELLTRMFMDPNNKIFNLFLDVLNEVIIAHKRNLNHWVYALLTRLINKLGTEPVPSIQTKLHRTIDVVRNSFPLDLQFNCVMRFLVDQTQTPNIKAKTALLNYLRVLLELMDPNDFHVAGDTVHAVTKIICWTMDNKNIEVRKAAQLAVIALFSLNTAGFSQMLSTMPKTYQDSAFKLLSLQLRRGTSDPYNGSCSMTPPSPMSPNSSSPRYKSNMTVSKSLEYDDTENWNPEEVHNSLKKTSAEIQSYSFNSFDNALKDNQQRAFERDSMSLDSGISQISVPDGRLDTLDEQREYPKKISSPIRKKDIATTRASFSQISFHDKFGSNGESRFDGISEAETDGTKRAGSLSLDSIINELGNHNCRNEERKEALTQLIAMTKVPSVWEENFKITLRILIETVSDNDTGVRSLALRALCELLKREVSRFQSYIELTLLKILEAHKDSEKEVLRAAEVCSATAALLLPADQSIQTLMPIIMTGDFPVNEAAIKMLTKIVENHSETTILPFLDDMMPGLIKACDNTESSVRKAAVFCMVSIHNCVGAEMQPHLKSLNGSKMKLLNLYIKRAQGQAPSNSTSPTSSPKNSTS